MTEPKLRTIKDVEKEFDERFMNFEGITRLGFNFDISDDIKTFISQSLRELLEQVEIEETEFCDCRQQIKEIINEILK